MKTNVKSIILNIARFLGGTICAGAVLLLIAASAQAQNLFVADYGSGNINEITPGGAQSTFASGLNQS